MVPWNQPRLGLATWSLTIDHLLCLFVLHLKRLFEYEMIQPLLCVCECVCASVCGGPMFVSPPIALGPKIETETLNEWHSWTFLPSASARSCPRLHRPPFKAAPFEYWRDNPPLSIMKQLWECVRVHIVCVHCVWFPFSLSLPPPPLPFLPLISVFSIYLGLTVLYFIFGVWLRFLHLMQKCLHCEWAQMCHILLLSKLEANDELPWCEATCVFTCQLSEHGQNWWLRGRTQNKYAPLKW